MLSILSRLLFVSFCTIKLALSLWHSSFDYCLFSLLSILISACANSQLCAIVQVRILFQSALENHRSHEYQHSLQLIPNLQAGLEKRPRLARPLRSSIPRPLLHHLQRAILHRFTSRKKQRDQPREPTRRHDAQSIHIRGEADGALTTTSSHSNADVWREQF